jgi:hypothetical protein
MGKNLIKGSALTFGGVVYHGGPDAQQVKPVDRESMNTRQQSQSSKLVRLR